jgi:hypothetical protein
MYTIAKLSEDQISALRQFEEEEHVRVLALDDVNVAPAELPDTTLDHLRKLEETLGVFLVAVR